jgi:hypothetical protein
MNFYLHIATSLVEGKSLLPRSQVYARLQPQNLCVLAENGCILALSLEPTSDRELRPAQARYIGLELMRFVQYHASEGPVQLYGRDTDHTGVMLRRLLGQDMPARWGGRVLDLRTIERVLMDLTPDSWLRENPAYTVALPDKATPDNREDTFRSHMEYPSLPASGTVEYVVALGRLHRFLSEHTATLSDALKAAPPFVPSLEEE